MKKLVFSISINASPERVWAILTGIDTYKIWTAVFSEGSTFQTDWVKGSIATFSDGKGHGMRSEILESIPGKFLSIHHLGELNDKGEMINSYKNEEWGDALENFILKEVDGTTLWTVELDMHKDFIGFMEKTWPAAQIKVKELAEA